MSFGMNTRLASRLREQAHERQQLDGIREAAEQITYDPISERAEITATSNMRLAALSVVLQLALLVTEGQDAEPEDEMLPSELLDALMLETLSDDDDDDIDPLVKAALSAHVADAFASLGVDDGVIDDMFGMDADVADTAIEGACQTVVENLPDDGDPLDEFAQIFAFGYDLSDEPYEELYDGAMYDGAMFDGQKKKKLHEGQKTAKKTKHGTVFYEAVKVMRHGKMDVVNKRIGGNMVLSGKQKAGLRKARKKAHTAHALKGRMVSLGRGLTKIYAHRNNAKALGFLAQVAGKGERTADRKISAEQAKINRMRKASKKTDAQAAFNKRQLAHHTRYGSN